MSSSPDKPTGKLGFTPDPEFGSPARGPPPRPGRTAVRGWNVLPGQAAAPRKQEAPLRLSSEPRPRLSAAERLLLAQGRAVVPLQIHFLTPSSQRLYDVGLSHPILPQTEK